MAQYKCKYFFNSKTQGEAPPRVVQAPMPKHKGQYPSDQISVFSGYFPGCSQATGPEKFGIVMVSQIWESSPLSSCLVQNELGNADL